VFVGGKKKAAYPAVISSPTAAHNGQKEYATHARFYGLRFELSIRSEAREETGSVGGDRDRAYASFFAVARTLRR